MKRIEIVVPAYNEQECIYPLFDAVDAVFRTLPNYQYNILYVDDGSRDGTLQELKKLKADAPDKIEYISFSRNFGKESAIYAGLSNSTGDYVVLMDADLQHPPSLIPKMIKNVEMGYDCCGAQRIDRKGEPLIRSVFSRLFYSLINNLTSMKLVQGGSDYRLMNRKMVDAVLTLTERERFTKGILSWVGFETKWIEYENVERIAGESKWSFMGLASYAINGFIAFATAPLRAVIWFGLFITLLSIIFSVITLISALISKGPRTGYTSIIVMMMFLNGVVITLLGIIGEYLARVYNELKHRPIYIERENTLKSSHIKE